MAIVPLSAQNGHVTVVVRPDMQSGKLIRSMVVAPKEVEPRIHEPLADAAAEPVSTKLIELIDQIAKANQVEGPLVHSVIRAESNYNPHAVSEKGALGLMQLIPATARRFGVQNAFDIRQNVEGGVRYLRFLLDYYRNDYPKAIAAYNAGEGAVDRYQGIPPYSETRNYVYQVAMNLKAARRAEEIRLKAAQDAAAEADAAKTGQEQASSANTHEHYNAIRATVSENGTVSYRTQ